MPLREISRDIAESREFEMKTYIDSMGALYSSSLTQNGMIFDIAMDLTGEFREITEAAVLQDSRIIKILRYCVAPSISQMKFGQFFGLKSTKDFEKEKAARPARLRKLREIAPLVAAFAKQHLDTERFLWLGDRLSAPEKALATRYARNWTCSMIADQNAQTAYRNWRKDLQETRIENALIELGYTRSSYKGDVSRQSDINVGMYSKERRVKGRTIQKADLVVHARSGRRLVLVEAKAVGVELDAYKRVKECCDKASDWTSNKGLGPVQVVAVVAGFLTRTNVETLEASGVRVVWEHNLSAIGEVLE